MGSGLQFEITFDKCPGVPVIMSNPQATSSFQYCSCREQRNAVMPLRSLTVSVGPDCDAGYVSDVLFELGALSVSVSDLLRGQPGEQSLYGEPPTGSVEATSTQKTPFWSRAQVTALFPFVSNIEGLLMSIAADFELPETPTFSVQSEVFDDKDPDTWVRLVQESFKPIQIGDAWIMFPWHTPRPGALVVQLEPGLAFGTGEHATTQLCIRWLQSAVRPGMRILDFGCGSGVLALFAVMLADNCTALGVDLDASAIQVAVGNAKRNHAEEKLHFCVNADEPEGETYDIVVANILAQPLRSLAPRLISRMKQSGRIALSGVLASQASELSDWYGERGVQMENAAVDSGWALLVGVKQ